MRRPLKPFVTEYKGTRRQASGLQAPNLQSPGLQSPGLQSPSLQPPNQPASEPTPKPGEFRAFDSERSRPRPVDAAVREDVEDSYEAAMRAADALFARPTPQPVQRPAAPATPGDETDPGAAPDRGGRILRALDEPPPPELVALEAAYAPKRRGRKPGSKNKPKIKPLEATGDALAEVPARSRHLPSGLSEAPVALAARAAHAEPTAAMRQLEAIPAVQTPSDAASQGSPQGSPSNVTKRFSWVRDRLKPGEGWKRRRLPRVCW